MAGEITGVTLETFTASVSGVWPANVAYAIARCWGAGGGGGGVGNAPSYNVTGGGGGAGGYSETLIIAPVAGSARVITVGAAGAGGAAGYNSGSNGGASSLGSLCVANGGGGGGGNSSASYNGYGGAGGAAGTGTIAAPGASGFTGYWFAVGNFILLSGAGADGQLGNGGRSIVANSGSAAPGSTASGRGSGGGGACCINANAVAAGGAGAPGLVSVQSFLSASSGIPPGDQLIADKLVLLKDALIAQITSGSLEAIKAALQEISLSRLEVSMNHGATVVTAGSGSVIDE